MAKKRMISKEVIITDSFLSMPATAMILYFFLNVLADDDGFVADPKNVMRQIRSGEDDMRLLIEKGFVLWFDSGVVVVRHWLINNSLRSDTYQATTLPEAKTITVNNEAMYEHIELGGSGTKEELSLVDLVDINNENPISRKNIKLIKKQLRAGESVQFELDTSSRNVEESREEQSSVEECGNSNGIPYSPTNLYGEEENVLLTQEELKKIYEKFTNPGKLINKISYILLNSKKRHHSHYAFLNKIALEDSWPIKKKNQKNEVAIVDTKPMTEMEIAKSLEKSGASPELIKSVLDGEMEYGEAMIVLCKERLTRKED